MLEDTTMRTILIAAAITIAAGTAQASTWDPANSSRDRQLWAQGMIGVGDETSSSGWSYEPASDRGARLVSGMSVTATHDAGRSGAYPSYDPASDRGARFGE
jgi:hypothetical protein